MQFSTKRAIVQLAQIRLHALVVLSILGLALLGRMPESQAGWITCPPQVVTVAGEGRRRPRRGMGKPASHRRRRIHWRHLSHTWHIPLLRSLLLWGLWELSGQVGPAWVRLVPWGVWLWQSSGLVWPWLRRQPEWRGLGGLVWHGQRGLMVAYLGLSVGTLLRWGSPGTFTPSALGGGGESQGFWALGLGCVVCAGEESRVEVAQAEDGGWVATLCGHFTLRVAGDHPFRKRLLLLFLRLLEVSGEQRGSRRTRDGRTPFVRQQYLARVFEMPQPGISRIEGYWLEGDWPNLLSQKTEEILTPEVRDRIMEVFATFPWWNRKQVHAHLQGQSLAVSHRQGRQAAQQSGWSRLRQVLVKHYHLTAESIRPRDDWLVEQLLAQIEVLLTRLETGAGLTPEERVAVADLQVLATEAGLVARPPLKALPWMKRVERVVFGQWEMVTDGTYIASTAARRTWRARATNLG